jgi:hypothetical protein
LAGSVAVLAVTLIISAFAYLVSENRRADRMLTETYARSGRQAMSRGQWQEAHDNLSKAIARGHPEERYLRLELAKVSEAMYLRDEAETIIHTLEGHCCVSHWTAG